MTTTLRYLGEDYCEVFDHGFQPGEWVGRRDLTDAQWAKLLANPQFEAEAAPKPPAKAKPRKKAKPRRRPFPKRPVTEAPCPPAAP